MPRLTAPEIAVRKAQGPDSILFSFVERVCYPLSSC